MKIEDDRLKLSWKEDTSLQHVFKLWNSLLQDVAIGQIHGRKIYQRLLATEAKSVSQQVFRPLIVKLVK